MRTFGQLSTEEREDAIVKAKNLLISHIVEGVIEVQMPNKIVQRDLDMILSDARKNENITLAKDMLTKHVTINRELDKISIAAAQGSRYDNSGSFLM